MKKCAIALVLLFAASCVASPQKPKPAKFLPPLESHGKTISGYGCDRMYVADSPSTSKSVTVWDLIVWAQYGTEHKKYWQKTYGTYQITGKNAVQSNGETAGAGDAIGEFEKKSYDFAPMDKACADWGEQMKSTLKLESNGERVKE